MSLPAEANCDELRTRLARRTLTTEFLASLQHIPPELAAITVSQGSGQDACINLVRTWRLRRDLQASYVHVANVVASELGIERIAFRLDEIRESETFAPVETALQAAVELTLTRQPEADLVDLAFQRQTSFWAEQQPVLRARWALAHTAGLVIAEADRIERELKTADMRSEALLRAYTDGDRPWCLLDTYQRTLERRWHTFEVSDLGAHQALEDLITRARQRFMQVGDKLASSFVHALVNEKFALVGIARQRDTFASAVRPALADGKTAYILVDALRFEMARELLLSFDDEYHGKLSAAIGTVPSITEIGMAALMPGAEGAVTIVPAGEGKIGLKIGDTLLKDRRTRLDWFRKQLPQSAGPLVITELDDMLPNPKPTLKNELQSANFVLVTSQEIDEFAESDKIHVARKVMDDMLSELARLVRKLREYGCKTIIITADHGYLFGDEIESDMKIDAPGGQTIDLHRRVWIGRGGAASDAVARTRLASFGLSDDLDIAVPWGFGVFKVAGGARAYFHGGMSPQELAIPVLVLQPTATGRLTPLSAIEWKLTTGTKKIANRFFSIQIAAHSTGLFEFDPPRVRIEVRSKGESVAEPVSATYGLIEGTQEIELRTQESDRQNAEPNTVTLMINGVPGKTASVHLFDAVTGKELDKIDRIEVALLAY